MGLEVKSKTAKVMAYLIFMFGILNLIDWLHGGRVDFGDALVGVGFILMSPGAFSDSNANIAARFRANGTASILAPLMYVGTMAVIAGFIVRWL